MSQLRFDPLQQRWVIVTSGRARKPADFYVDRESVRMAFSPFSGGNEARTPPEVFAIRPNGGGANTAGWSVRVVPNKFPVLGIEGDATIQEDGRNEWMDGVGVHEVVIESPDAMKELAELSPEHVGSVFEACRARLQDLVRDRRLRYLLVFKNHGVEAGSTIPHSHTQIIGLPVTPSTMRLELNASRTHYAQTQTCLFCERLANECESGERIVAENDDCVAFTPYASRFPFEVTIAPRKHHHSFRHVPDDVLSAFGDLTHHVLNRLKAVLKDPPYNFALHTAPNTEAEPRPDDHWQTLDRDFHWHLEVIPRLTQVAGFEWGTGFYVNSMSPEAAAAFLREDK